jgi:HlyD family secretion protein
LLDKPSKTLIPGSQVNVEIISKQRQNVVTLPLETVQNNGKESFVWVQNKQGKAEKQPVTLGLEDLTSVELTSGLEAGEQVILPSPNLTLTPGIPLQTNPEISP